MLWDIIREYQARGRTILITTHNMEEADTLCARIAIVDHGKVIALGTPAELKASIPGGYLLRLRFARATEALAGRLRGIAGVSEVSLRGENADIYAHRARAPVPPLVSPPSPHGPAIAYAHL